MLDIEALQVQAIEQALHETRQRRAAAHAAHQRARSATARHRAYCHLLKLDLAIDALERYQAMRQPE